MSTYRNEPSIVNVIQWKKKWILKKIFKLLGAKMKRINHFTVGASNFNNNYSFRSKKLIE